MFLEAYKRWMETDLEEPALKAELESIEGNEEAVTEDITPTEQTTQIKESPIPSKEENQSQIPKVYTVQKGDTL